MSKKIKFIWIGKLKKKFWVEAFRHYWNNISKYYKLEEVCLKDAPAHLSLEAKLRSEAESIAARIEKKDCLICLDRQGRQLSSPDLANLVQKKQQDPARQACFILGGAYGLSPDLLNRAWLRLSLGAITLPHEFARIVLLEQIYRAATINFNHPYHH